MRTFSVRLGPRPGQRIPVVVGEGVLRRLVRDVCAGFPGRPVVVVTDSHVGPLHARRLVRLFAAAGRRVPIVSFRAGERSKSRRTKERIEDALAAIAAGRDTVVVALGGGVVGDLAGFVAATWHRGVPVVQAPTSMLAMVDAALGGKTGVDIPGVKNAIGAFHQPWGLYADVATLTTLPDNAYRRGFAEVVKMGAIADAGLFALVEREGARVLARDPAVVETVVARCLALKGRIVASDERDLGPRMALNFGHTVAHAIEVESGFAVPHGAAVAVGLVVESRLAVAACGLPESDVARVAGVLATLRLPTRLPRGLDRGALIDAMRRDKKVRGERLRFALPAAIGRPVGGPDPTVEIGRAAVARALALSV